MLDPLPDLGWRYLRQDTELVVGEHLFRSPLLPILILGIFLVLSLALREHHSAELRSVLSRMASTGWLGLTLIALFSAGLSLAVNQGPLGGVPHSQDEIAYLHQARALGAGRIFTPAPARGLEAGFRVPFMLELDQGWVGKYPPGWPMILAPFASLGLECLANPCLNALALLLFAALLRAWTTPVRALAGILLIGFSPFFIGMGASYLSHPADLVAGLLMLLGWTICNSSAGRGSWILGLGASIILASRPLEAPVLFVPIWMYALYRLRTYSWLDRAGFTARAVILPIIVLSLTLAYHHRVTGDAFLSPFLLYSPSDHPGFSADVGTFDAEGNNLFKAVINLTMNSLVLNEDLFGWPFCSLALPLLGLLLPATWSAQDRVLLLMSAGIYLLYFTFMGHGICFGARYYYILLPAYGWFTLRGIEELGRRLYPSAHRGLLFTMLTASVISATTYVPRRLELMRNYWNVRSDPMHLVGGPVEGPTVMVIPDRKLHGFRDLYDSYFSLNALPPNSGQMVFIREGPWLESDAFAGYATGRKQVRLILDDD